MLPEGEEKEGDKNIIEKLPIITKQKPYSRKSYSRAHRRVK